MTTKQLALTVAVAGVLSFTSVLGVQSVFADQTASNNPMSSLVEEIAQKFNLNQDEVQAVFDEHRDEMHDQMTARLEDRLQQAVDDGEITSEQKDKIVVKLQELHDQRQANQEAIQNLTMEERHQTMELQKDELEQWAEENDIPVEYLHIGGMRFHHHAGPEMMH